MSYTQISSQTLSSNSATVTFSSIPSTYRDIFLVMNARGTSNTNVWIRLNGDTGTNYPNLFLEVQGTTARSRVGAGEDGYFKVNYFETSLVSAQPSVLSIDFLDYARTDRHKTVLGRYGNAETYSMFWGGRWASTSAISTILLSTSGGGAEFASGSIFTLYGIEG